MFSDRSSDTHGPPLSMTGMILLFTTVVFLAQQMMPGEIVPGLGQYPGPVEDMLALDSVSVRHWELWRLLSYTLVHDGWSHIICNMWGLFVFGPMLEPCIGRWRFLLVYAVSGLLGSGLWLLFNWQTPGGVVGASGSVCGVVVAAAVFFPNVEMRLLFPPVAMRLKTFAVVFAIIDVISELAVHDNIAHLGHLGGMLGGLVLAVWMLPRYQRNTMFSLFGSRLRQAKRKVTGQALSNAGKTIHRCAACGATDKSHPQAEFRYCTQCQPTTCFCEEHIRTHAHLWEEPVTGLGKGQRDS